MESETVSKASHRRFNKRNKREKALRLSCKRKNTFESEEAAKVGATELAVYIGKVLTPYQCERCSDWHLTKGTPYKIVEPGI